MKSKKFYELGIGERFTLDYAECMVIKTITVTGANTTFNTVILTGAMAGELTFTGLSVDVEVQDEK